ncbi:MAG: hypothetical protein QW045_02530 [Candidatus Micrarchaeaceae archaeon]
MKAYMLYAMLAFALLSTLSAADSMLISPVLNASMHAFLEQYMPNSTIANYSYSLEGNYVIMNSSKAFMVLSLHPYSFVVNASLAYNAIYAYLLGEYNAKVFSYLQALNASINSFVASGMPSIHACLVQTGLNASSSCTAANFCFPCQTVPACSALLSNTSTQPIITYAISNFSQQYSVYEHAYTNFENLYASTNISNAYSNAFLLSEYAEQIMSVPANLQHNPLFPIPTGFNFALFKACPVFVTLSSPWYCRSLSYCQPLHFNATASMQANSSIASLESMAIPNSTIKSYAENAVGLANSYMQPVLIAQKEKILSEFFNSTKPLYNSTISNATNASMHVYNSLLEGMVSSFKDEFASVQANGIYANVSLASNTMAALASKINSLSRNLSEEYANLSRAYANARSLALEKELEYPSSASIASLAAMVRASAPSGKVNSTAIPMLMANLSNASASLSSINSPSTMAMFVKSTSGWFASMLAYIMPGSIASKQAAAPFYASLLPFIIGMIILLILYQATYARLSKKKRIKKDKSVKMAWMKMFLILFIGVLAYSYVVYSYAASANSFLPINAFIQSVQSSKDVAILVNQNVAFNASTDSCIASVLQNLRSLGKNVSVITENNMQCNILSNSSVGSLDCINPMLLHGLPVIFINDNGSYISYRGIYGNMLYASGSMASGPSCPIATVLGK